MTWTIVFVAFNLVMVIPAIAELRQSVEATAVTLADRVFVAATFSVAFIYSLVLLATEVAL